MITVLWIWTMGRGLAAVGNHTTASCTTTNLRELINNNIMTFWSRMIGYIFRNQNYRWVGYDFPFVVCILHIFCTLEWTFCTIKVGVAEDAERFNDGTKASEWRLHCYVASWAYVRVRVYSIHNCVYLHTLNSWPFMLVFTCGGWLIVKINNQLAINTAPSFHITIIYINLTQELNFALYKKASLLHLFLVGVLSL